MKLINDKFSLKKGNCYRSFTAWVLMTQRLVFLIQIRRKPKTGAGQHLLGIQLSG